MLVWRPLPAPGSCWEGGRPALAGEQQGGRRAEDAGQPDGHSSRPRRRRLLSPHALPSNRAKTMSESDHKRRCPGRAPALRGESRPRLQQGEGAPGVAGRGLVDFRTIVTAVNVATGLGTRTRGLQRPGEVPSHCPSLHQPSGAPASLGAEARSAPQPCTPRPARPTLLQPHGELRRPPASGPGRGLPPTVPMAGARPLQDSRVSWGAAPPRPSGRPQRGRSPVLAGRVTLTTAGGRASSHAPRTPTPRTSREPGRGEEGRRGGRPLALDERAAKAGRDPPPRPPLPPACPRGGPEVRADTRCLHPAREGGWGPGRGAGRVRPALPAGGPPVCPAPTVTPGGP